MIYLVKLMAKLIISNKIATNFKVIFLLFINDFILNKSMVKIIFIKKLIEPLTFEIKENKRNLMMKRKSKKRIRIVK